MIKRQKISLGVYKIIKYLSVFFLFIQVIIISYTVFGRFVLNKTPRWSEELALLCMVWFSLLSVSLAEKNKANIRVQLSRLILPVRIMKIVDIFNVLIKLLFSLFMIIYGVRFVFLTKTTIMPGLDISRGWLYLSVPVSGLFLLVTILFNHQEAENV
jgi:TRAP-type C4-dicarboxylate transport system permease small subunit